MRGFLGPLSASVLFIFAIVAWMASGFFANRILHKSKGGLREWFVLAKVGKEDNFGPLCVFIVVHTMKLRGDLRKRPENGLFLVAVKKNIEYTYD